MAEEAAAKPAKKGINVVLILVPVAVVAALVLIFALPVTHRILVNGPLHPLFARIGLAGPSDAAKGKTVAAPADSAAEVKRLGALLDTAYFPGRPHPGSAAESDVLLLVAEAARDRHTLDITHVSRNGCTTERTVHPYGVVAHAGHWYLTAHDGTSGEIRTFRLDRVTEVKPGAATFDVPANVRPQDEVLGALARTPWRHLVSVKVHADPDAIQSRMPLGLATMTPLTDERGWTRVEIRAERLFDDDARPTVAIVLRAETRLLEHVDDRRKERRRRREIEEPIRLRAQRLIVVF